MAAPTVKKALDNFVLEHNDDVISVISDCVLTKEVNLLTLVESLGIYLTSTENEKRCRSTKLLADILHRLPQDLITEKEVSSLVVFFCDRLKDHHSITPYVLQGLSALACMGSLNKDSAIQMMRAVYKEVPVQSLNQEDRRSFYNMVASLLSTRLEAVKPMGADFVYGFVQSMDTEKDPRNLVIAFSCVTTIAQHFPLGIFAEELFEVIACYFPVDFSPPPNDPYGIKKSDLVTALRRCMCASPKFAEHCLPLILEKLTSTVLSSKLDALLTLVDGAEIFGAEALKEYESSLWSGIRREVCHGLNEAVDAAAFQALKAMVRTIDAEIQPESSNLHLRSFIDELLTDSVEHMTDPEQRFGLPSARLLQTAASASDTACQMILRKVLPVLEQQIHKYTQVAFRRMYLKMIKDFSLTVHGNLGLAMLSGHKDNILPLLLSLLIDPSNKVQSETVASLAGLVAVPGLLTDQEFQHVGQHITNIIISCNEQDDELLKECTSALGKLSETKPDVIQNHVIPIISKSLQEECMVMDSVDPASSSDRCRLINVLSDISTQPSLVRASIPVLTNRIIQCSNESDCDKDEMVCICCCLCRIASYNTDPDSLQCLLDQALRPCLRCCVLAVLNNNHSIVLHTDVLQEMARFFRVLVCKVKNSTMTANDIVSLFLDNNLSAWNIDHKNRFSPFETSKSTSHHSLLMLLFMAVICSLPPEVEMPRLVDVLKCCISLATRTNDTIISDRASKCLAGLINKYPIDENIEEFLDKFSQDLLLVLSPGGGDNNQRSKVMTLLSWVTRGLVIRGHAKGAMFTDTILGKLGDHELGAMAAEGVRIILNDTHDVMTTEMHANIRIMYKQRFFVTVLPQLVNGIQDAPSEQKPHYLTALSHLLHCVPKQVLSTELPQLLPLLVQSLMTENVNLQKSTMTTLSTLIEEAPTLLTSYVDSLIPQMLRLAQYKPDMNVRIAALCCLSKMCSLPNHVIYPHQRKVIRQLGPVLDDQKRLVRVQAVEARNQWFLVGTAEK